MISFIVIGKNEGWKITNCLSSIFSTIEYNNIKSYEVLYVDSKSNDDTVERVLIFPNVKIFKLLFDHNAAIARNVGANESLGTTMFFIDGDMELIPESLQLLYKEKEGLKYDFCSGDFVNYFYNSKHDLLFHKIHFNLDVDTLQVTTGGLFLIKRDLWFSVSGMRNVFRRSQDLDLGLRISKNGTQLLRIKEVIVKHHTILYENKKRMFSDILRGNYFYKGLIIKKNIFNREMYKLYFRNEITLIILIVILLSLSITIYGILVYLCLIIAKGFIRRRYAISNVFIQILRYFISDITTLISLLFFWPKTPNKIQYININ